MLVLLLACSVPPDTGRATAGSSTLPPVTDTGTPQSSPSTTSRPTDTTPPTPALEAEVALAPTDSAWVHRVEVVAAVPVRATVTLEGPSGVRTIAFPEVDTTLSLPLIGVHADTAYRVEVQLTDDVAVHVSEHDWVTEPLPEGLPQIDLHTGRDDGHVLLAPFRAEGGGWAMVLDGAGAIVWASDVGRDLRAVSPADVGGYQALAGDALVVRSWEGEELARYAAEDGAPTSTLPDCITRPDASPTAAGTA